MLVKGYIELAACFCDRQDGVPQDGDLSLKPHPYCSQLSGRCDDLVIDNWIRCL